MKVTKIEAQQKTRGRYSVFVDDKFAFGVSDMGLLDLGVKVGQSLSDAELNALKDSADKDRVYGLVLGLISRRPRSIWEISEYLARKKIDEQTSQEIIDRLLEKNLLNDHDFAERWVASRRLLKSFSKRKLEQELKIKRVDTSIINKVLQDENVDDSLAIKDVIEKKRKQSRYKDDTKLKQYLLRQGFSYSDISKYF